MKTILRNAIVVVCLVAGAACRADDAISNLTRRLNSEIGGLWMNGAQPSFALPSNSTPAQVVARAAQAWRMTQGTNGTLRILELRTVQLNGPMGSPWMAAFVECASGKRVLLFRSEGDGRWWTRFFDVEEDGPKRVGGRD